MITTPIFRAHLDQFQATIERLIETPEGIATAETGFMKRRDHLAEMKVQADRHLTAMSQAARELDNLRKALDLRDAELCTVVQQRDKALKALASARSRLSAATRKIKALS